MKNENIKYDFNDYKFIFIISYIVPFTLNTIISNFFKPYIKVKGAILMGIPKLIFLVLVISVCLYILILIIKILKELNLLSFALKNLFLTPFVYLWIVSIWYSNFSGEFYNQKINVLMYILLFGSQCMYYDKLNKYEKNN